MIKEGSLFKEKNQTRKQSPSYLGTFNMQSSLRMGFGLSLGLNYFSHSMRLSLGKCFFSTCNLFNIIYIIDFFFIQLKTSKEQVEVLSLGSTSSTPWCCTMNIYVKICQAQRAFSIVIFLSEASHRKNRMD